MSLFFSFCSVVRLYYLNRGLVTQLDSTSLLLITNILVFTGARVEFGDGECYLLLSSRHTSVKTVNGCHNNLNQVFNVSLTYYKVILTQMLFIRGSGGGGQRKPYNEAI